MSDDSTQRSLVMQVTRLGVQNSVPSRGENKELLGVVIERNSVQNLARCVIRTCGNIVAGLAQH